MDLHSLNFHHLFCFWMIAREGTVGGAAKRLRLSQPTLSAHLRELEERLGTPLFVRSARRLVLTDAGRLAFAYAQKIFSAAQEFIDALGAVSTFAPVLRVGVVENFPHLVALRFFDRVLKQAPRIRLLTVSASAEQLFSNLLAGELALVLIDSSAQREFSRQLQWLILEDSPLAVYAPAPLAARIPFGNLEALANQPFLLPGPSSPLRPKVQEWLNRLPSPPQIVGEIDNSALLKALAISKGAFFVMPYVEANELQKLYHVRSVYVIAELHQHYYAVALRRVSQHSTTAVILSLLRNEPPAPRSGKRIASSSKSAKS